MAVLIKYLLVFSLYSLLLFLFGIYIQLIKLSDMLVCFVCKEMNQLNPVYDYIVVGCGSAGSLLALRLAEDKRKSVLVLEAGPASDRWLDIPGVGPLLQLSAIDWKYQTVPQKHAAKAFTNQVSNWPMGRVVGGTSALNNMIYLRGHPSDFKQWYKDLPSYNYETDILSYYKKTEQQRGAYINDTRFHATNGPLHVGDLPFTSLLAPAVLSAAEILGYSVRDLNSGPGLGFMQNQVNIKDGTRWTPAHKLYYSTKKPNLVLQTNSFVHKVLFKSNYEAYAVRYSHLGQEFTVRAREAVVLSTGVIGTPKLLMLSGVGAPERLAKVGIKPQVHLDGVGENLQDHVTTGSDLVLLNTSVGVNPFTMLSPGSVFDYFYHGRGPWTLSGCEVLGVIDTESKTDCHSSPESIRTMLKTFHKFEHLGVVSELRKALWNQSCSYDEYKQPDLELMVIPIGASTDGGRHLRKAGGISDKSWNEYFSMLIHETAITVLPIVLHPKSRGTVRLSSKDPYEAPLINPNYLSDQHDVDVLLKGISVIKKIISTKPMQELGARLNMQPFPGCEQFEFDTASYWECYVRHVTITSFHPGGTCKMGHVNDPEAVVGHDFKVHCTNKLFIVDASVMPSLPSGNPYATVLMLAEKAADEIKYHNYVNLHVCRKKEIFRPRTTCKASNSH